MMQASPFRIVRQAMRFLSTLVESIPNRVVSSDDFVLKLESETEDYLRPPSPSTRDVDHGASIVHKPANTLLEEAMKRFNAVRHCLSDRPTEPEAVVRFFIKAEVPPEKLLQSIDRYPEMLSLSVDEVQRKIQSFSLRGLKRSAIFEMLIDYPEVLSLDFDRDVEPVWNAFKELWSDDHRVADVVSEVPVILLYSLDLNIAPINRYFLGMGCNATQIRDMIESYPSILSLSIKQSIQPKIDYLRSRMPTIDVRQAIVTFPAFLDMSLETHIKEKVIFFLDELEVDPLLFAKYLPYFPQIFSCEIEENIKRKIEFLCLQMSITEGRGKRMKIRKKKSLAFMACPSLFGFSIARLMERIEQMKCLILRNQDLLDDLFYRCPLLFGCTVDVLEVEQVKKMMMNFLSADRLAFLRILKTHPEILMRSAEEVEAVTQWLSGRSRSEVVATLSDEQSFTDALKTFESEAS